MVFNNPRTNGGIVKSAQEDSNCLHNSSRHFNPHLKQPPNHQKPPLKLLISLDHHFTLSLFSLYSSTDMSHTAPIDLSDSDDDENNNNNNKFTTPITNYRKRPRLNLHPSISCESIVVIDPTPPKLQKSASSTKSFVPETPFSEFPKFNDLPVNKCTSNFEIPLASSANKSPGDNELIFVGSDDEPGSLERRHFWKTAGACAGSNVRNNLDRIPKSAAKEQQLENKIMVPDFDIDSFLDEDSTCFLPKEVEFNVHVNVEEGLGKTSLMNDAGSLFGINVEQDLSKRGKIVAKDNCQENASAGFLDKCHHGNLESTKTYDRPHLEDDINQIQPAEEYDQEKECVRLVGGAICETEIGDKANAEKKQNKDKQAASRKQLMEEKKREKEQEKCRKAMLKAEAAKQKQLEKEKKRLEKYKFSEKDIVAEVDPKVLSGSLGGPLLTMFADKHLNFKITPNPIEKTIVWRMNIPDGMSQLSTIKADFHYILLIYNNPDEFCKHVNDGSLVDHISSVRKRYPLYTVCCLTSRLMSFINKREQQKYKNEKVASDWKRPPVEEVFAKLITHFAHVHSRQCADEAEVAEHVGGLTINLAKCYSRKKLTHLSVSANGCNVPKDCVDRELIMRHPWLKALISIPKVQPRYALAIWKKYPTLKSLLLVYMDTTKTEKELILKDLPLESLLGNERKLGVICSKRVYRVLMAENGSNRTDDVEEGADYFSSQ
ncbi:hypothetical protein BVRB_6g133530 isoform B [Beta vulgaris subsp. vulgaris]|uniref:uncharacterized protein LOC104895492 isoform X2 n=1 Tax=Beta vulgaris subsp. vulgaris TaxID=3555 RepID=UPI00065C507F|nr:uncharacterized protein LOC104895492 isoform X2 [Beta vulgaris subsp. vulgaris]KMT09254.1 hypothetical protein BVRB_6g133530 isoform B [Beta vulgaris subsp. vulgaris]